MPVPGGYGSQTIDFLCCVPVKWFDTVANIYVPSGLFLGIETKSTGEKPTARQELCMQAIRHAGGIAFWCDSWGGYVAEITALGLARADIKTGGDSA
jgi:hypothetical protein